MHVVPPLIIAVECCLFTATWKVTDVWQNVGGIATIVAIFQQKLYLFCIFPLSFLLHIWNESERAGDENSDENDDEDICI